MHSLCLQDLFPNPRSCLLKELADFATDFAAVRRCALVEAGPALTHTGVTTSDGTWPDSRPSWSSGSSFAGLRAHWMSGSGQGSAAPCLFLCV